MSLQDIQNVKGGHQALYRKWRPSTFSDVVGQDHITGVLKYQVSNGKTNHAYLFCGSRGTGKTSCAKILARAVNCESPLNGNPCNRCAACRGIDAGIATDVIEMDAASNNGIDAVRDMQDELAFTPAELKYRVYIIDEVHMMSTQAFNALLKTLEEPPNYVIFILATTEYHKLPTTIVSRCQRFDFKRIDTETIISRLTKIANAEGIEITEDAARIIARVSRGGMRDAISLLELCAGAHTLIDEALVFATVGGGNRDSAYKIIDAVRRADYATVYGIINDIVMKSGDLSVFWQEVIDAYRDVMVVKSTDRAKAYLDLTDSEHATLSDIAAEFTMSRLSYHVTVLESAMADMQRAFNSKRSIAEIALTRMCDPKLSGSYDALLARVEALERELSMIKLGVTPVTTATVADSTPSISMPLENAADAPIKPEKNSGVVRAEPKPYQGFSDVVSRISSLKPSLSAGLSSAVATKEPDGSYTLVLNEFFARKLSGSQSDMALIRGAIAENEGVHVNTIRLSVVGGSIKVHNGDPISEIESILG